MEEAVINAVMLEQLSRANLDVLATGKQPHVISDDELKALTDHRAPVHGRWAYFTELLGD